MCHGLIMVYLVLLAHVLGDFYTQTDRMAEEIAAKSISRFFEIKENTANTL